MRIEYFNIFKVRLGIRFITLDRSQLDIGQQIGISIFHILD
jgi:hypothetical protein